MRRLVLSTALVVLLCSPALAVGPAAPMQQAPVFAAQMQSLKLNEVTRMKVTKQTNFSATGIKGMKEGDEVEVKRISDDTLQVKHLPTGQTGVMPQPR